MGKIKGKFRQFMTYLNTKVLLDKEKRKILELIIISGVFCLAGFTFTIINFITKEYVLGYVTLAFGVISLITTIIAIIKPKWVALGEILFVSSALIMFFYFMLSGGAGDIGFSTYWIIILPFVSMMVLGLAKGSIVTAVMLLCICLMLWVPAIRENVLTWKPDRTFIVRFPLAYLAAFASSALFEYSRYLTDKANEALKAKLEDAACHDPLTGLTSRYGMNKIISSFNYFDNDFHETMTIANCFVIDVDNFKSANDNYGHLFGDKVLVEIGKVLKEYAGEYAIRFGGDEFVLLYVNKSNEEMIAIGEEIRQKIESLRYEEHPEAKYTVSIGVASHEITLAYKLDRVIGLADEQSARAKKHGKNAVYVLDFDK